MGIRFSCPNGHKLHVKEFLAGKRGVCPSCGAKFVIPSPTESQSATTPAVPSADVPDPTQRTSSPSVVIPVDPQTVSAVVASPVERATDPTAMRPDVIAAPEKPVEVPMASPSVEPAEPTVSVGPVSAAAKYVAHRDRARRRQMVLAIVLAVTVIVLAAVLVWILLGGPSALTAAQISAVQRPAQLQRGTVFGPSIGVFTESTGAV